MPHIPDSNTVAYWSLNEAAGGQDYQSATSENGLVLSQATASLRPVRQGGPASATSGQQCLWFELDDEIHLAGTPTPAMLAAALSDISLELWWYKSDVSGTMHIFAIEGGSTDASEALNNIFELTYETSTQQFDLLWESGVGTNRRAYSNVQVVPANEWHHIAVTCEVVGADRVVIFYYDGVAIGTDSDINATGGSSATVYMGGSTENGLTGGIADVRLSRVTRTPQEILASAQSSSYTHANDANTLELWRFAEAPEAADSSGNGYHLHTEGADPTNVMGSAPALALDNGRARRPNLGTTEPLKLPFRQEILDVVQGDGKSWSFQGWFQVPIGSTADHTFFGVSTSGESADDNIQVALTINDVSTARTGEVLVETGSGSDTTATTASELFTAATAYDPHHLAVVRSDNGDSTSDWLWYIDGVLIDTLSAVANPTGGDDAELFLGTSGPSATPTLPLDDISISNVVRDVAYILAESSRGGAPDGELPVVDNFTPLSGTVIEVTDPITFDVTDTSGLLAEIGVYATFPDGSCECVHFNNVFAPLYSAGSSRVAIDNGFTFTVRRTSGWPLTPVTISVVAVDGAGNVGLGGITG